MTQEEKSLLLQDLCARLPYGVKVYALLKQIDGSSKSIFGTFKGYNGWATVGNNLVDIETVRPYLRPLASMTEEEKKELLNLLFDKEAKYFYINEEGFIDGKISDLIKEGLNYPSFCPINIELYTDFLLSHHFDYRGLIEKDLAFEAPEGMYNY